MAIPVASVAAAITNLTSQIQTQVNTDSLAASILVCIGDEGADSPDDIIKISSDVRMVWTHEEFIGSFQTGALLEEYEIDILASSYSGSPDPTTIVARVWQLVGYVTTAIRTDPSLGGLLIVAQPFQAHGGNAVWTPDPVGRLCEVTVTVRISNLN